MLAASATTRTGAASRTHGTATSPGGPSRRSARSCALAEVPPVGGDTLFADMHAAYEGLPESVRDEIDGLTAIHDFTRVFGRLVDDERRAGDVAALPVRGAPRRPHASRDRPQGHLRQRRVHGRDQGHRRRRQRGDCCDCSTTRRASPEYQCRFRWRADSIAFWDNRSTQHYAVSDYFPAVRVMERVTVAGDRPY